MKTSSSMILLKLEVAFIVGYLCSSYTDSVTTTRTIQQLHPGLFFSNRPALNDKLGQAIDSGSVTLSCVGGSRGNNRVYFKWYKDGQLLQADRSPIVATIQGDLNINPSDYSRDNGQYQCLITDNTFSLLSNMAELQLAYVSGFKKTGVTRLGTQYEGWKYVFTGYTHSKYPKPRFLLKFNNKAIAENERISVSEKGDIYIAQLSTSDAGDYTVEMQLGSLTQSRETITLQVSANSGASDIYGSAMLGPRSQTIGLQRESEATFECFVTGKPMPVITWKKGDRRLVKSQKYVISDHNKRLTIKNLNKQDSGIYQCAYSRATGSNFPTATLTVIEQPVIKAIEPTNQIGYIGSYITLTCMVTGMFSNVGFSLNWYRNGVKLSQNSRTRMTSRVFTDYRNFTLNVTALKKGTDSGMYQCFAVNNGGRNMAYTSVNVFGSAPYIYYGPGVVYAVLGRTAKIECRARGSPPITYKWEKNGNELPSVNPRNNGKNGTYIIQTVRASDAGQYACVASNGPNPADTHKSFGRLELVAPTVVVNKSVTVFASLGNHPYLYCGVRYDKKVNVTYRWYFRGQQILRDDSRRTIDSEGRLTIRGVFQRDNAVYRCDSSSSVGDYSTTIELKVQAPPFATTAPKVSDIRPDSVVLQWSAGDDGNSAIHHFKIGIKVPVNGTERTLRNDVVVSGTIKRYQVPGLAPNTYYQFRIRAVNSVGNSPWSYYSKQIKTREAAPSYKLQQVRGLSRTKTSIEVTWEAPPAYTHNGVLRGYYVSWKHAGVKSGTFTTHRVTPASKRKYLIQNLFSNSRYEVKVQMFNDAGGGPFSDPVVLRTKEEVPSSPPRNLLVLNVSSRSVLLQWDDPPQQDWNGQLSGYTVLVREFHTKSEQRLFAPRDPSTFTQVHNVTNLKTYTQYIFSVSAKNSVGGSSYSNEVQVKTTEDVPSAPQRLQIVDQFSDTISVNWLRPREVNGVLIGYTVKYWKVDQYRTRIGNKMTDEVAGNALQAGITNLDSRSSYIIEVAAKTNAGVSKWARIQGRTQDVAVQPGPPSNLRSLETNATTLKLTWREGFKGNSPITKYLVQGNNETGFENNRDSMWFDALVVINPYKYHNLPPVIIESLRPFTTYRFRVKAWNKVAASDFSEISGEITTQQAAPESPPLNLRVKPPRYPGELTLKWTPPPRETWNSPFIKYTIELQEQGERNNFTKFVQSGIRGNARQSRLFSLSKFTKYEITMKTVNERGESPRTPVVIGQTQEHVPDLPPSKIRAIAQSGSSISLTWDDVDEKGRNGVILGYKIFYRLVKYAPQEFKEINVNNVKQYTLDKLLGYSKYDVRILAYTRIGDGKMSDRLKPYPMTLESKPGPPSQLRFPTITPSVVVVNWGPPEMTGGNITKYQVSYRLRDDASPSIVRPSLVGTKYTDTVIDLSRERYYIFEVAAFTVGGGWGEKAVGQIFTTQGGNIDEKPSRPLILPIKDSHITWRSILVRWAVGKRRDQPIRYFTLQYRKGEGAWERYPKPLSGDSKQTVVWGLESSQLFSFEITATNDAGDSLPSLPSPFVRTLSKSLPGSPRDVRITSPTPNSFLVSWKPPLSVDVEAPVVNYVLGYRLHQEDILSNVNYNNFKIPSASREYQLASLKVYTLYDLQLHALDSNNNPLPSYIETRRTSARLPPRPVLHNSPNAGPTSITISWDPPTSTSTPLLGYKADFNLPSRRRRAVSVQCESPQPGVAYFSNTSTNGRIGGLRMYTSYVVVLKSFNSAGDSERSNSIRVTTAEGLPGAPATFVFDGVYVTQVHLYWEAPCEPNGIITDYILTVFTGLIRRQTITKKSNEHTHQVMALTPNTNYRFRLVAKTSRGEGIPKVLEVKTKSVKTKPDPPTIVSATSRKNDVILIWRDQFDGNTPITQYIVEYRSSSEKNPWTNGWNLKPSQTLRNRTDGTRSAVLENLQALTVYWFRMITRNEAGLSIPGDSSSSVSTGIAKSARQSAPVYEEVWFISVMAVIGFLILLLCLIIICCCCCKRQRSQSKTLTHPISMDVRPKNGMRSHPNDEETLSNGSSRTYKDEKPLFAMEESEPEDEDDKKEDEKEEDEASSLESKSDIESDASSDDISTKKRKMEADLREKDKRLGPKFYGSQHLFNSPPPAYATFASKGKGRSEPVLDFDSDDDLNTMPYRPPTRRPAFHHDDAESSESSEVASRKRGDPRSNSFRRALVTTGTEPEQPYKPKPKPRKYRSLEQAMNDSFRPPNYHEDDDDDDLGSGQPSLPPEYRSDDERVSLTRGARAESPTPDYQSDDSSGKHQLINGSSNQPAASFV